MRTIITLNLPEIILCVTFICGLVLIGYARGSDRREKVLRKVIDNMRGQYHTESILKTAEVDGIGSMLLTVQQDCIAANKRIKELGQEVDDLQKMIILSTDDSLLDDYRNYYEKSKET